MKRTRLRSTPICREGRLARAMFISACLILLSLANSCRSAHRTTLTISAAASLQDALAEVETAYQRDHGSTEFRNNFGSSGTLAQEIVQGAPVDLLISAGTRPVDRLERQGLLVAGSRRNLLRNSLVLVAPSDSHLQSFFDLTDKARLIALGDPASVPAGQYGQQTLQALHLYDALQKKIVLCKDVRQVLAYVETGNADAGLVYATDAEISKRVRVVTTAPESTHAPIVYPLAIIHGSLNEQAARDFATFLDSAIARAIFTRHGFTMA